MYSIKYVAETVTQFHAGYEATGDEELRIAQSAEWGKSFHENIVSNLPNTPALGYGYLTLLDELNSLDQIALSRD